MTILVSSKLEVKFDDNIPDNYVIIPTEEGWHILRGDEYLFLTCQQVKEIYLRAEDEWIKKGLFNRL